MHLENHYRLLEEIVLFVFEEKMSIRKTEVFTHLLRQDLLRRSRKRHIFRWLQGNRQTSQITETVDGARGTKIIASESRSLLLNETISMPLSKRLCIDSTNLNLLSRLVKWFGGHGLKCVTAVRTHHNSKNNSVNTCAVGFTTSYTIQQAYYLAQRTLWSLHNQLLNK
jgi:hypothetical protein